MPERMSMNSKSLQEHFPDVYRAFFSRSVIVISTTRMFTWAGEYSEMFGGLNIMQKLPLRIYIGLEPINTKKIKIGLFKTFTPYRSIFSDTVFNDLIEQELAKFIYSLLPDIGYRGNPKGFIINILTELPLECGLGSVGSLAAALTSALFLYFGQVSPEMIKNWSNYSTQQLINNPKLKFQIIHRMAWEMEGVLDLFPVSGIRSFTSMISSVYPIVYFTKKDKSIENIDIIESASNPEESRKIIRKTRYWALRYEEILKFKCLLTWPIDFGLIFSGDYRVTGNILRSLGQVRQFLNQTSDYVKEEFQDLLGSLKGKKTLPFFYQICLEEGGDGFWDRYTATMSIASMQVLKGFRELFTRGASDEPFFKAINLGNNMLKFLDVSTHTIDFICSYIQDRIRLTGENPEMAAVKLTGAGKGGDVLFAVPYGSFRNIIINSVEKLRGKTGKDIWLDYASWLDGFEKEGVKIEQFLTEGIRSKFISEGTVSLKKWTNKEAMVSELSSLERLEKEKKDIDLLIDILEEKIYIKGQKLTSHELHSASTTIEILKILLENTGKNIANKNLPESSYSQDRNEMQSKIVSPLTKIVKQLTRKKLLLKITGGLTEFYLKLEPSDLDIRILEKIF